MNINKQALLEWLERQIEKSSNSNKVQTYYEMAARINAGLFDAPEPTYPTPDVYEAACQALWKHREEAKNLRAALERIKERAKDESKSQDRRLYHIERMAEEALSTTSDTSKPCQTCGVNIESACPIGDCELKSESTGAERVRKLWNSPTASGAYRAGIRDTIEAIGWKIPGINAPEKEENNA